LRKDGFGSFDVWKCNLKTYSTDKVRDLPVKADEILVFEKTEDARGFNDGAGDYGFREIAITANGDKLSELDRTVFRIRRNDKVETTRCELCG